MRAIAPYVKDKFTDPAVVSVDEAGRFAVPLLSATWAGPTPWPSKWPPSPAAGAAVSTATDVNGLFAVDVWAREHRFLITDRQAAKQVSAACWRE